MEQWDTHINDVNFSVTLDNIGELMGCPPWWDAYEEKTEKITAVEVQGVVKAQTCRNMFFECKNMVSVDLSGLDTSGIASFDYMFGYCPSLTAIDLSEIDASKVSDCYCMLFECNSLKSAILPNMKPSTCISMFGYCNNLSSIDLTSFDTHCIDDCKYMFNGCTNLKRVFVNGCWSLASASDASGMFCDCPSLVGGCGHGVTDVVDGSKAVVDSDNTAGYLTLKDSVSNASIRLSGYSFTYLGSPIKPDVNATLNNARLSPGHNCSVTYKNNIQTGTATVVVKGTGYCTGSKEVTLKINKARNGISVKTKKLSMARSKLKKKSRTVALSKLVSINGASGKITYKKTSGNKKITVTTTGKIRLKKGLKKGAHKAKVLVTAGGDSNHEKGSKTATLRIR